MNNRSIVLASRPDGVPTESDFQIRENPIPHLIKDGDVLVKLKFLTVDPYMRARMRDVKGYLPPFQIGEPLVGGAIGEVLDSKSTSFKKGDLVHGFLPWVDLSVQSEKELTLITPEIRPATSVLGVLGMPGMTAYFALIDIGNIKAGETVVISGAAGAVGIVAGQIAKLKGLKVVGIAGSDEKCRILKDDFGFDECVNYKSLTFQKELLNSTPNGVDVYLDNVGGDITDCVIKRLNRHARIALSGQISSYNLNHHDVGPRLFIHFIVKSVKLQGFLISDYKDRFNEAKIELLKWMQEGHIKNQETIAEGLENAPKAFIGLFAGDNIGKQLVKV